MKNEGAGVGRGSGLRFRGPQDAQDPQAELNGARGREVGQGSPCLLPRRAPAPRSLQTSSCSAE